MVTHSGTSALPTPFQNSEIQAFYFRHTGPLPHLIQNTEYPLTRPSTGYYKYKVELRKKNSVEEPGVRDIHRGQDEFRGVSIEGCEPATK